MSFFDLLAVRVVVVILMFSIIVAGASTLFAAVLQVLPWVATVAGGFVLIRLAMETAAELRHTPALATAALPVAPLPKLTVPDDVPAAAHADTRRRAYEAAIAELNSMIGLTRLKREINNFIEEVELARKQRERFGRTRPAPAYHMVFAGPPGTGKTTVARLMGAILAGIGILSRGQVIETNRNGLVGEYIGHSGPKTEARLREARGGVLFIDEAYGLCTKGKNDFGDEVINTLLKYLEDCRADLVVIVAGYDAEMRKLLQSNKGLASRFPFTFHFEDYTPAELRQIFNLTLEQHSMMLTPGAGAQLDLLIAELYQRRDPEEWANGREMRRLCESVFRVVAARVRRIPSEPSDDDLRLVTEDDIVALRATALA